MYLGSKWQHKNNKCNSCCHIKFYAFSFVSALAQPKTKNVNFIADFLLHNLLWNTGMDDVSPDVLNNKQKKCSCSISMTLQYNVHYAKWFLFAMSELVTPSRTLLYIIMSIWMSVIKYNKGPNCVVYPSKCCRYADRNIRGKLNLNWATSERGSWDT